MASTEHKSKVKALSFRSTEYLCCSPEPSPIGLDNTCYRDQKLEAKTKNNSIIITTGKDIPPTVLRNYSKKHNPKLSSGSAQKYVVQEHESEHVLAKRHQTRCVIGCTCAIVIFAILVGAAIAALYFTGYIGDFIKHSTTTISPPTTALTHISLSHSAQSTLLPTTLPVRTTPYPATCEILQESRCLQFNYTRFGLPNSMNDFDKEYANRTATKLFRFAAVTGCYEHAERFVCSLAYPECIGSRTIKPCREFCEEFKRACNYGIFCEYGFPDDDDPDMCVVSPSAKSKKDNQPIKHGCNTTEYQCGHGGCVSITKTCDGNDDCGDFSDEIYCSEDRILQCDFDNGSTCGYTQSHDDHFDWIVQSGQTLSLDTGPDTDHTQNSTSGSYLVAEASGRYPYDKAILTSPKLNITSPRCFRFYYHMRGVHSESLKIFMKRDDNSDKLIWFRTKDQGDKWKEGVVTLPVGTYSVLIETTRGIGYKGDIAIDDITSVNGTCPNVGCPAEDFTCGNTNCILQSYVCNGQNDCGDYSDEKNCNCSEHEFRCRFGMCIPAYQQCDKQIQCPDGSDEQDCECPMGQHRCPDGKCIMREWLCDRQADCSDGSDEYKCEKCDKNEEFACTDYECVPLSARCNGIDHCKDGSDEHGCVRKLEANRIEFYHAGEWLPVCYNAYNASYSQDLCKKLGMGEVRSSYSIVSHSKRFVHIGRYDQRPVEVRESCAGDKVLAIECAEIKCGVSSKQLLRPYIANGQSVPLGKWPWVVSIRHMKSHTCGGALLNNYNVITAAHCFVETDQQPSNYEILLGTNQRSNDNKKFIVGVRNIRIHPSYNFHFWGNDVAIITLKEPVTFSEYVRPICLPDENEAFLDTSICYSAGWGITASSYRLPEILQEGKMRIWSDQDCRGVYGFLGNNTLCAGYRSGHIANCAGDSGGPLMCLDQFNRYKLVGVFSFLTVGCDVPMHPPVFGRVNSVLAWIQEATQCKFQCDNSKCLFHKEDLCNGVDDCGDSSDETSPCNTSLNCSFENIFTCGYAPLNSASKWSRQTSHDLSTRKNARPLIDHTLRKPDGRFMTAESSRSVLVSPLHTGSSAHCLSFYYHMRAVDAGFFRVYRHAYTTNLTRPDSLSNPNAKLVYSVNGHQGDRWIDAQLDVPAGHFIFTFEAVARPGVRYSGVSVDDIEVTNGTCSTRVCETGLQCYGSRSCLRKDEMCNFIMDCADDTDENQCSDYSYKCSFDNYGLCSIEQPSTDHFDWDVTSANDVKSNGPQADHTTGNPTGYMAYINGRARTAGSEARMELRTSLRSAQSCLILHYHMFSSATLSVIVTTVTRDARLYWSVSNTSTEFWNKTEILLSKSTNRISIRATIGATMSQTSMNYIAIDDVIITKEPCVNPVCRPDQYQCSDGSCIEAASVCNNKVDCKDYSDELMCECKDNQFKCDNGVCISAMRTCDGVKDCLDGSDEKANCTCLRSEFQCADGRCMPGYRWCDGFNDCGNWSDEHSGCQCRDDQFRCTNGTCIPGIRYCDGYRDCPNSADEPENCTCSNVWSFRCKNGKCIDKSAVCDLIDSCGDHSDEDSCPCRDSEFTCANGKCISSARYCNGIPDCPDGSDEKEECSCPGDSFQCRRGGCISKTYVCDRQIDCFDGSDEVGCKCGSNEFRCNNGLCIQKTKLCDAWDDCGDGSDEEQCTCSEGEFRCKNNRCLPLALRCDGNDHCGDESDEEGCACRKEEYKCPDGRCIQKAWRCDGSVDCFNGTDELNCSRCSQAEFTCKDYSCVDAHARCDGVIQCADESDEHHCVRRTKHAHQENVLEVYRDGLFYQVCDDNWNTSWSQIICGIFGEGKATATKSVETSVNTTVFLRAQATHLQLNISMFQLSQSCISKKVIAVECQHEVCGSRSDEKESQVTPYLIGGNIAKPNSWPWMAGLFFLGQFKCGASLINQEWLVTGAHCFYYYSTSLVTVPHYFDVLIGSTKLNDLKAAKVKMKYVILHPRFMIRNLTNDVALVRLSKEVDYSASVRPICVPKMSMNLSKTSVCYTAGWGLSRRGGKQAVQDLREAKMSVWSSARCSKKEAWGNIIDHNKTICAGYESGYISSCYGDSGGPLMCVDPGSDRWTLHGTLQGGRKCGATGTNDIAAPGVYSDISRYTDWIQDTITRLK